MIPTTRRGGVITIERNGEEVEIVEALLPVFYAVKAIPLAKLVNLQQYMALVAGYTREDRQVAAAMSALRHALQEKEEQR
jgi:hypothetical protein